jgi:Protein of unknown function (DUF3108)
MAHRKPLQTKLWLALLVALFALVLIVHLTALTLAHGQFGIEKSVKTTAFTTRMIELPAVVPVVQQTPADASPQKRPPKVVKPKPAPVPVIVPKSAPALLPVPIETATAPLAPLLAPELAPSPEQPPPAPVEVATPTPEPVQATTATATAEAGAPAPAFTALSSGRHMYKVIVSKKGNPIQGEARLTWQQDGEKYALELSISAPIELLNYKSSGTLSPQGLMPLDFYDKTVFKSTVAAHFVYAQNKITFSTTPNETELIPGAQDRNSIFMQIAGLLSAGPARYTPGTTFSIQIVNAREAESWLFTVNEPETLNLETGSQIAWRLTRNPRREFDRKIELWFVPAMNYLPVRYRQTESNGDYQDMVWRSTQVLPNTLMR